MENSLFWYQSPHMNTDDMLFVDGKAVELGKDTRTEAMREIRKISNKVSKYKAPWCGFVNGLFFMKGFFKQKDDYGRNMAFMFYTPSKDYKNELAKTVSTLGFDMEDDSHDMLVNHKNFPTKKITTTLLIISLLIIITLLIYGTRN